MRGRGDRSHVASSLFLSSTSTIRQRNKSAFPRRQTLHRGTPAIKSHETIFLSLDGQDWTFVDSCLDGNIMGINFASNLAGFRIETLAVVGGDLATLASNDSRPVPLLNSMVSLPKIADSLSETGRVNYPFSSFHMGSVEPPVNGSLIIGGYDNNKIMGDILNWTETYNSYRNPGDWSLTLTHIYVGVDSGFLPLENLRLTNQSFP
ncbi:hypothetical protein F4680DRAFT_450837 [Xylaria scruposa]|nr:hypothetical protein F4680DRAFT_450837 [Xylaria scruposa]